MGDFFFVLLTMPNSNSSSANLFYIEKGNGPETLLFIHGMGCNSAIWNSITNTLSKKYRCIAIDLPDHGKSINSNTYLSLTDVVEQIHHFILQHQLDKSTLHLVGHSMGAQISIILAIRYPSLFSSQVLIAPAGVESYSKREQAIIEASTKLLPFFSSEEQIKTMLKLSWFNNNSTTLNNYLKEIGKQENFSYQHYFKTIQWSILAMLKEPVDSFLKSINIPTLIVFGEEDKMIPNPLTKRSKTIEIAKNAQKQIANSSLLMIPKKGHFLPFEAENECISSIKSFLKDGSTM